MRVFIFLLLLLIVLRDDGGGRLTPVSGGSGTVAGHGVAAKKSSENELLSEKIEDKNISDLISTKPAKIKKQMNIEDQKRELMDELFDNRRTHPPPFSLNLLSIKKLNKEEFYRGAQLHGLGVYTIMMLDHPILGLI